MSSSDNERTLQVPPPEAGEVEAMLDRIRPGLVADGGNLELLGIDADGTVRIELQGECATCPARVATLRVAIEEPLRQTFAGVTAVVAG
jgi:Fe-S cluster biogenesis protein NfuA